eukprot:scaffold139198_cov28-Tisochrysis_lutea.AAC.2
MEWGLWCATATRYPTSRSPRSPHSPCMIPRYHARVNAMQCAACVQLRDQLREREAVELIR